MTIARPVGSLLLALLTGLVAAPIEAAAEETAMRTADVCEQAFMEAEKRYGIPEHLLIAVARARAGRSPAPRAVTVCPGTGQCLDAFEHVDPEAATAALKRFERTGIHGVRIGCGLLRWDQHKAWLGSVEKATDPALNAGYLARYLKRLKDRHGGWTLAINRSWGSSAWHRRKHVCDVAVELARLRGKPAPDCGGVP